MDRPRDYINFNMDSLISVFRFIQTVEEVLSKRDRQDFTCDIKKDAKDNFGKHWRGYRALISGRNGGRLYIHFGCVYLPETRRGIYLELDRRNNLEVYASVWDSIMPSDEYDLNKDEADYLKFFFPLERMDELMSSDRSRQDEMIENYFAASVGGMLKSAERDRGGEYNGQ